MSANPALVSMVVHGISADAKLMRIAAGLLSDGENHEYDRALTEVCCEFLGLPTDDNRETVLEALREVSKYQASGRI